MKQNVVYNENADNKCQTKARIKAKCVRNAYTRAVCSYVEREGERKDVPAPVAKANPVITIIMLCILLVLTFLLFRYQKKHSVTLTK